MKFKSFAEVKRALVVGSIWSAYHYGLGNGFKPIDMGKREVSIVQSNAVAFKTDRTTDSWLYFPKAKNIKLIENGFTTYTDVGFPILTYKLVD